MSLVKNSRKSTITVTPDQAEQHLQKLVESGDWEILALNLAFHTRSQEGQV